MRISTKGRYSLEALLYMALLPGGECSSTRDMAKAADISEGYLEQLFIPLRKAGIVRGIRGPRGGYVPGRELNKITAGEILRIAEGGLGLTEDISSAEAGHSTETTASAEYAPGIWAELYRELNRCVDSITLADLAEAHETMDQTEYAV